MLRSTVFQGKTHKSLDVTIKQLRAENFTYVEEVEGTQQREKKEFTWNDYFNEAEQISVIQYEKIQTHSVC